MNEYDMESKHGGSFCGGRIRKRINAQPVSTSSQIMLVINEHDLVDEQALFIPGLAFFTE
jgi:hypothetical protein